MISTHGDFAARIIDRELAATLARTGISDANPDRTLDGVAPDDYYRETYHSAGYIREVWSRYLDVVEIRPGGLGHHQDLVVLTRGAASDG